MDIINLDYVAEQVDGRLVYTKFIPATKPQTLDDPPEAGEKQMGQVTRCRTCRYLHPFRELQDGECPSCRGEIDPGLPEEVPPDMPEDVEGQDD